MFLRRRNDYDPPQLLAIYFKPSAKTSDCFSCC